MNETRFIEKIQRLRKRAILNMIAETEKNLFGVGSMSLEEEPKPPLLSRLSRTIREKIYYLIRGWEFEE